MKTDAVRRLEHRACSRMALLVPGIHPGYVHEDLGGGDLSVLPDGYHAIDWQKTKLGPTDADFVTLLESMGIDLLVHIQEGIVWISSLLRIHWLTACALQWFPEGTKDSDASIARPVARITGRKSF